MSSATDIVFVRALQLAANIGPDCWGRTRPQPVAVSVYLHLRPAHLAAAGAADDVAHSVNYGTLAKALAQLVADAQAPFAGAAGLADAAARAGFALAGDAAAAVRVVVDAPKLIPLAASVALDVTVPAGGAAADAPTTVSVQDVVLAVVIGVNAPERLARQRVLTNLVFAERAGARAPVDYAGLVARIAGEMEATAYLTLEAFVVHIARTACLASEDLESVTVRAQKPSALTFADSSGVEITRRRSFFAAS